MGSLSSDGRAVVLWAAGRGFEPHMEQTNGNIQQLTYHYIKYPCNGSIPYPTLEIMRFGTKVLGVFPENCIYAYLPERSKGFDLRSNVRMYSWVQIPQ